MSKNPKNEILEEIEDMTKEVVEEEIETEDAEDIEDIEDIEDTAAKERIHRAEIAVHDFLSEGDCSYRYHVQTNSFEFGIEALSKLGRMTGTFFVHNDQIRLHLQYDEPIIDISDKKGIAKICEYITRVNNSAWGCTLGFDFETGELDFDTWCDTGSVQEDNSALYTMLSTWVLDIYEPFASGLYDVLHEGKTPAEVLKAKHEEVFGKDADEEQEE